jgi:hypothetical protein
MATVDLLYHQHISSYPLFTIRFQRPIAERFSLSRLKLIIHEFSVLLSYRHHQPIYPDVGNILSWGARSDGIGKKRLNSEYHINKQSIICIAKGQDFL